MLKTIAGIFVPLLGTSLGAICVYFISNGLKERINNILNCFAGGVMTAASVWSLLLPAISQSVHFGRFAFFPATSGLWIGIIFLISINIITNKIEKRYLRGKSIASGNKKTFLLILAVVLHNIPEGMAVGAAFAGMNADINIMSYAQALSLAIGISIQNFPEGAIISMPLHAKGIRKSRSFFYGFLSGAVEPAAAAVTIMLSKLIVPVLPYFLGFAAGAMIYVVANELLPESKTDNEDSAPALTFCAGFSLMMLLDVIFG